MFNKSNASEPLTSPYITLSIEYLIIDFKASFGSNTFGIVNIKILFSPSDCNSLTSSIKPNLSCLSITLIKAFINVVFPVFVAPEIKMFFFSFTYFSSNFFSFSPIIPCLI